LYWLEVLSLIKQVDLASSMISSMMNWIGVIQDIAMATDMCRFVAAFAGPISQSAPRIYLSALPFAPVDSVLSKHYLPQYKQTLSVQAGGEHDWPTVRTIMVVDNGFYSVTFSPDGRHIASGSSDNTIMVWDAQTGNIISGPFKGHTSGIYSVAFSPDSVHVILGSADNTIIIWDAQTGNVISGPFLGHTESIKSVTFSPDSRHIVSGSSDDTIRVWELAD
ncbi:hypothetical protein PILCRDRAFT_60971, partial [Piloderma croceum F 1598]